jgi:DNA modification methylase
VATARRNGAGKGTSSSSFGSSGRENHDSSRFYSSRMYATLPKEETGPISENPLPPGVLDTILCRSSVAMADLPDSSVHLMVTSPPYNAGKEYDEDLTLAEYFAFLRNVWREVHRVLVPGGRACINVANLGRRPYIPLNASIWQKGSSSGTSTAWGSWMSPSNPTLRDTHEYIQVFSKGGFGRKAASDRPPTITKEQFLEYTKSVWTFSSESARRVGHPAPFPVELPYRLIQLYTFEDEIVLDPFMGSGQTAIAALQSKRHFVGYEIDPDYIQLAQKRIIESSSKPFTPRLFELAEK